MAGNTIYVQGSYVDVHDNEVVNLSVDKAGAVHLGDGQGAGQDGETGGFPNDEHLARAIEASAALIWGNAAYAVVYCVCRDRYGMPGNMTAFERRLEGLPYRKKPEKQCPKGTLTNAFSNNAFYHESIDRWESLNVQQRTLRLRDELIKQLESLLHGCK